MVKAILFEDELGVSGHDGPTYLASWLLVICVPLCPTFHSKTYLTYQGISNWGWEPNPGWWMLAWHGMGTRERQLCQLWGCCVPTRRRIDRRSGCSQPKKSVPLLQKRPWYNEGKSLHQRPAKKKLMSLQLLGASVDEIGQIDPQESSSTDSTVLPCSCQIPCSVLLPNCPGTSSQQERCLYLSRFSLRCVLRFVFCARPWVVGESIEMLRLHKAGLGSLVACQDGCPSKSATFHTFSYQSQPPSHFSHHSHFSARPWHQELLTLHMSVQAPLWAMQRPWQNPGCEVFVFVFWWSFSRRLLYSRYGHVYTAYYIQL